MEFKEIQELIKAVNESNISKVKIKNGDFEICIKQAFQTEVAAPIAVAAPMAQVAAPQVQTQQTQTNAPVNQEPEATKPASSDDTGNLLTIKSPLISTLYRSPSPDKAPYVAVGDTVKKGDIVCIVEAMKLFNEIESEVSGKIVKILVDDASPVEYDQPLFLVEPN